MPQPLPDYTVDLKAALAPVIGEGICANELCGKIHNDNEFLKPILIDALKAAQAAGLLKPCPNGKGHGFRSTQSWDRIAAHDIDTLEERHIRPALWPLERHIAKRCRSWSYDPDGKARAAYPGLDTSAASIICDVERIETVTPAHLDLIVGEINNFLQQPQTRMNEKPEFQNSGLDGSPVYLTFDGWSMVVAARQGEDLVPMPVIESLPPVRHHQIETQGRLVMFSARDTDEHLQSSFSELSCDTVDLPPDFNAHTGANKHTLNVYAASGIMEVHFGQHFTIPCLDGDKIRGMRSGEDTPPEGLEPLQDASFDHPVFAAWEDLATFVGGDDKLENMVAEGHVLVAEVPAGPLHVYLPDGRRTMSFAKVFAGEDCPTDMQQVPSDDTCFVISPTPLDLRQELVTEVDMPTRHMPMAPTTP
jgi:hypothetical protein